MSKKLEYKTRGGILVYEIKKAKDERYIAINGFKEGFAYKNLNIPAEIDGIKVKEISTNAFYDEEISNLTLPEGLVTIKESAFECCDELKKVVFPTSLCVIEDAAFSNCCNLTTVKFNEGLESIGSDAFRYTNIQKLTLPDSLIEINSFAFECSSLSSVTFGSKLKTIGERAFSDNPDLKSIKFNEELETIGEMAFDECGVESIVLPDSLKSMEYNAFNGCTCLKDFHIGKNFTNHDFVGILLFDCPKLKTITVSEENENFSIIDGCLYDMQRKELVRTPSNVKSVTIPKWVKAIAPACFYDIFPDTIIIKPESLDCLSESFIENAKTIRCVPGSKVEEWALDRDVYVEPCSSRMNVFVDSLTNNELEIND